MTIRIIAVAAAAAAAAAATLAAVAPVARAQSDRLARYNPVYARLTPAALRDSARARLATIDGEVRVPGLHQRVEVLRDRWGIPHIYAANTRDLFFAQGYVAAQDRLFQMDIWRRQGEGKLAEVLGPSYVARDRLARLFRYRGDVTADLRSYAPDAPSIVAAFVAGINAYVDEVRADRTKLPIEFTLLDFLPEHWSLATPISRVTPLSGVDNGYQELLNARLVQLVGAKRATEIIGPNPWRTLDPAPGLDLGGLGPESMGDIDRMYADVAFDDIIGSNNWTVSGRKTATGMPILANDPHRVITNPAVRYMTHLVAPGWNVIGAGEPGSPGVAIGHNDRIAFGLTIVGMDQQDIYVDTLTPGTLRTIRETIAVRGEAPRAVTLQFSPHGPVVSIDSARRRAIVVKMVSGERGTAAYLASLTLDRARDWKGFQQAMARWMMPSENMVYADVDGNIGWIAAGMMPRRSWSGLLPVPGNGRFEWTGHVPITQLPQRYNPASGYIATANDGILRYMPSTYRVPIAYDFPLPSWRADRLHEVLRDSTGFTVADFERLQHDDLSLLARRLAPAMVDAATRAGAGNRREVRMLASWDHHMRADAEAPLVFEAWSLALQRAVAPVVFPTDAGETIRGRAAWRVVDSLTRAGAVDPFVIASLDSAVATIDRVIPAGAARQWGTVHVARLRHPVAPAFDLPPVPRGGHGNTVFATGGPGFRQTSGASYQQVIDLGDFDRSVAINVPGQSGQPESPHYADLLPKWATGEYIPLAFSRARVEAATAHRLALVPASR